MILIILHCLHTMCFIGLTVLFSVNLFYLYCKTLNLFLLLEDCLSECFKLFIRIRVEVLDLVVLL